MVFMILVQFKDCTPSVYLRSQELETDGEGRDESTTLAEGKLTATISEQT